MKPNKPIMPPLQNYIKLDNVIRNTAYKLKLDNVTVNGTSFNDHSHKTKTVYTFNTLIATGYNVINVLDDKELIKTNFDFMNNNQNVLLDFNYNDLTKLVRTKAGAKGK